MEQTKSSSAYYFPLPKSSEETAHKHPTLHFRSVGYYGLHCSRHNPRAVGRLAPGALFRRGCSVIVINVLAESVLGITKQRGGGGQRLARVATRVDNNSFRSRCRAACLVPWTLRNVDLLTQPAILQRPAILFLRQHRACTAEFFKTVTRAPPPKQ